MISIILTGLNGNSGIVHVTPDVGENLGLQPELADGFAIQSGLLRCSGGSELDVLYTKGVKSLCDGNLRLGIEERICELFALCERERVLQWILPQRVIDRYRQCLSRDIKEVKKDKSFTS
jgi:hypothetical protein